MKQIQIIVSVWEWMSFPMLKEALENIGIRVITLEDIPSSENQTTNKENK